MSFTYEDILHLALPSDDDESHGNQLRANWAELVRAQAPNNLYFVSPGFTTANLGNADAIDRRHFPTIQEAVTAAEGASYSSKNIVLIYPGDYFENIVTNGNVSLAGRFPPIWESLGGGLSTHICGTATLAHPTIKVNPDGVGLGSFNLINLALSNVYAQDNAVLITEPYLLDITKPATYDSGMHVGLKKIQARMQTWGLHNQWESGIRAHGKVELVFRDVDLAAYKYAGGAQDGGILRMIELQGDYTAAGSSGMLQVYGKNLNMAGAWAGSGIPSVFWLADGVGGTMGRSNFPSTSSFLIQDKNGSTPMDISGLSGTEPELFFNSMGIDLSWF